MDSPITMIEARRGDGEFEVREVVRYCFYFRLPHLRIREDVFKAIESVLESPVGSALQYIADPNGNWHASTRVDVVRSVRASLVDEGGTINGTISLCNDPTRTVPDSFLEYNGFALDRPRFKDRANFLYLWSSSSSTESDQETVISTIRELATRLPISFASCDRTLIGKSHRVQQLARRYVGVDVADVSSTAIDLGDKAAGVYWVNVYGDKLAPALRAWVREAEQRQAAWQVVELPDRKMMLIASSGPRYGDRNRRELLPDREMLARGLSEQKLLHVPTRSVYFKPSAEQTGDELQRQWHQRFVGSTW